MGVEIARRGLMLVLSSPSGAGKTTLANRLLEVEPDLQVSVSVTTRQARPGEAPGKDYIFVDEDTFRTMRDEGAFAEWALVFDHFYGTPKKPAEEALSVGRDILFDIDWQGAAQLKKTMEADLVSIFVLPPSAAALTERLKRRAQDSSETVKRRMAGASNEIQHWTEYTYVVVNEDVEESVKGIRAILDAERLVRTRRTGLESFVRSLQADL
ncbi:MAG: guanylate kinase [Methyloligellaceae bacterium]